MKLFITLSIVCLFAFNAKAETLEDKYRKRANEINSLKDIDNQLETSPMSEQDKKRFDKKFDELGVEKLPTIQIINKKLNFQSKGPKHTIEFKNPIVGEIYLNGYRLQGLYKMNHKQRVSYFKRVLRKTAPQKNVWLELFPKAHADADYPWLDEDAYYIEFFSLDFGFLHGDAAMAINKLNHSGFRKPHKANLVCDKDGSSTLTLITVDDNASPNRVEHTIKLESKDRARSPGRGGYEAGVVQTGIRGNKKHNSQTATHTMRIFKKDYKKRTVIHEMKAEGSYNWGADKTEFGGPQYCEHLLDRECKYGQKRPGEKTSQAFSHMRSAVNPDDRDENYSPIHELHTAMYDCCGRNKGDEEDQKACAQKLNEDDEFGIQALKKTRGSVHTEEAANQ